MAKLPQTHSVSALDQEALDFHSRSPKGKIGIDLIKPLNNQRDLSLAYSPGVAAPCLAIQASPETVFEYTSKGNIVAVISNGTAVLGLGNLGANASLPVMEGKSVLFKRFADIDSYPIVINSEEPEEIINVVKRIGGGLGGINLEDIAAPACFIIEKALQQEMDIPVFHDDQHGTAIITVAGLLNAALLTGRNFTDMKIVVNGAGAAAIACVELLKHLGAQNITMCDTSGVIYQGREKGMNPWKSAHAVATEHRTLAEAMRGADVFLGLSVKGAVDEAMVASMASKPIIFAMANPDPEIDPKLVHSVRQDGVIMATGRSDYPNQVNNVMGFPYIFRGALDVQASTINTEMKIAAARAIADLARKDVPDSVSAAYSGKKLKFGPQYIIPTPFDPRLIIEVPIAVAEAAMQSGVARKPVELLAYREKLQGLLNPQSQLMSMHFNKIQSDPKRLIFAEGDDEQMIRAAVQWRNQGYGIPILVGHVENITKKLINLGVSPEGIEINNAAINGRTSRYIDELYSRLQRQGYLKRDCARMVKRDRNIFASLMLKNGEADGMITGRSRPYSTCLHDIKLVLDVESGRRIMGLSVVLSKERTIFIADTAIATEPTAEDLVEIAIQAAKEVRALGHVPRVALISYANFGNQNSTKQDPVQQAVQLLDKRSDVSFEYDGEMQVEVALQAELHETYPFCRLTGPANILIMPGLHSASVSTQLYKSLSGGTVVGPILCGFNQQVQIMPLDAREADIINLGILTMSRVA